MIDIILRATLTAAVAQGTPLLLTALGEIMNQRAGVLNLGLDGMMLFGAVTAFISSSPRAAFLWRCSWAASAPRCWRSSMRFCPLPAECIRSSAALR